VINLTFQIKNGSLGTYLNNSVPTGYYTLCVKLMDNGYLTMGAVEVVRIINNEITLGVYNFTEINQQTGNIIVNIAQQMNNPFAVIMTGKFSSIFTNQMVNLSASVPSDVGEVVYVWYINGESKGTGGAYLVDGLPAGIYRIDVTAFTVNGLRAGSTTNTIHVVYNPQQAPVNLGTAGNYAILAESGINSGANASVTGNIGISPNTSSSILGLILTMDGTGTFSTSVPLVTGKIYAANYSGTTASILTIAVNDMIKAYGDTASRIIPDSVNTGAGELGGKTIIPGIYKWNSAVSITTDLTLNGGPNDVWIFQINGALSLPAAIKVKLTGGAQPGNIFWQIAGAVSLGASSHIEGTVLSSGIISLGAGGSINGRLFGKSSVILGAGCIVKQPVQ